MKESSLLVINKVINSVMQIGDQTNITKYQDDDDVLFLSI